MLERIIVKIRALIEDSLNTRIEVHTYTTSKTFFLKENNPLSLIQTLCDGNALGVGQSANLEATTGIVTLTGTFTSGNVLRFTYTFAKYSDSILYNYARSALVYLSLYGEQDFELEGSSEDDYYVSPTPDNQEEDLIAIVAALLINPNFKSYKFGNVTITLPETLTKDAKIKNIISDYYAGIGVFGTIILESDLDRGEL